MVNNIYCICKFQGESIIQYLEKWTLPFNFILSEENYLRPLCQTDFYIISALLVSVRQQNLPQSFCKSKLRLIDQLH